MGTCSREPSRTSITGLGTASACPETANIKNSANDKFEKSRAPHMTTPDTGSTIEPGAKRAFAYALIAALVHCAAWAGLMYHDEFENLQ
jgi:hypothetical protein